MGVRISDPRHVTLYCSVEGVAFGPVFEDSLEAEEFLEWFRTTGGPTDPRSVPHSELMLAYAKWKSTAKEEE